MLVFVLVIKWNPDEFWVLIMIESPNSWVTGVTWVTGVAFFKRKSWDT